MPRILFITTKIGFGHERVSNTLATCLKDTIPGCQTKTVTYFDFFHPRFQSFVNTVYLYGLKWFPRVFGYIYLTQTKYKGGGVEFWFRFLGRRYAGVIKNYSPDLIVITQGLACQWLGRFKKRGLIKVPLVAVITDFIVHPFWVSEEVDYYLVATAQMRMDLIRRGISGDRIVVTGIPIDPRFNIVYNRDNLIDKLGLCMDRIKVLIMGGGWGLGRMDRILMIIDKMDLPLELLIVTGRNRGLYRRLKKKIFTMPTHIYGKVDNICELMAVSDFIITKPGGVTVSELLAMGLPAILWDIIPGQEEANAEYLVNAGVAIRIDSPTEIRDAINRVLLSKKEMSERSKRLGMPNSAIVAVREISACLTC